MFEMLHLALCPRQHASRVYHYPAQVLLYFFAELNKGQGPFLHHDSLSDFAVHSIFHTKRVPLRFKFYKLYIAR